VPVLTESRHPPGVLPPSPSGGGPTEADRLPFQLLFESAPGPLLVLSPQWKIVAVSDAYLRATMTTREGLVGRDLFEAFPDNPDDAAATGTRNLRDSLRRVLRDRAPDAMAVQKYDIRRPEAEGGGFEERYWSPVNSPVPGPDGDVAYVIHRVEDVTEFYRLKQREVEQERLTARLISRGAEMETEIFRRAQEVQGVNRLLREANARLADRYEASTADLARANERARQLAAIVESSDDGIVGLDLAGAVTDWNRGAERLFGYAAAEVAGRPIFDLLPAAERAGAAETLGRLRRGEAVPPYEAVRGRKDGTPVSVSVRLSPIRDGDRVTGVSLIYRDLTESRRLEQQLHQSQKMEAVGQLAGGIAHDFNNLLTVINGYSDLLLGNLPPGDPGRAVVEEIYKAGERAALLTRQLLAFSRRQVVEPRVIDLNGVVGEAARMLRRLVGEDITLTVVPAADLGRVRADPGQVEQVLLNLVVNARDAMARGGHLTIETADVDLDGRYARSHLEVRPGRYAMLAVSDTGVGMDEATKARIFEPFFTTKGDKGTGLGLATVYGIVKQAGGSLYVYSEPGRGTTFKVYLPVVDRGAAADQSEADPERHLHGTGTVLLVEDEPAVRALSRMVLEMYGYTVLEAANGGEALRVGGAHAGPIHLLVTDVVMPGMGGREVAERLRPRLPDMRVLYVSGYTDDAVVRHGVLAAETAFLQKPFTPVTLAAKVREVLGG
jgi:PAS domain S-box-containing protein